MRMTSLLPLSANPKKFVSFRHLRKLPETIPEVSLGHVCRQILLPSLGVLNDLDGGIVISTQPNSHVLSDVNREKAVDRATR